MSGDEKLIEAMIDAYYADGATEVREMMRAALAVVRQHEGWSRDMVTGRQFDGEVLLLLRNGAVIRAQYDNGLINESGEDCWGWHASIEGVHPPCWTDGICWAENEDGEESVQPVAWMPFPVLPA